ncbi:MAG: hypothetical protein WDN69_11835 [Aliidongia sp.]
MRHALECGHTVFMVSWRNTPPDQGHLTWDDYPPGRDHEGDRPSRSKSAAPRSSMRWGFCVGGTMLACAVAIQRALGEDKVASLTLLTTLLDFVDPGEIGLLVDETSVQTREITIGKGGILPGRDLSFVFSTLRANDLIWPYVVNNYLKGTKPPAFDLLSGTPTRRTSRVPGIAGSCATGYLENKIRLPGRTTGCGVPIDLGRIGHADLCHGGQGRSHPCLGPRPFRRPPWSRARPASCSAPAAMLPGSSIRRKRRSAASGSTAPMAREPKAGSRVQPVSPAAGGATGPTGWPPVPTRWCRRAQCWARTATRR